MTFSKLGTDTLTSAVVELPQTSRRQGLYIIGANGTGKTGLIENLVVQDINQGLGVGVLDPHGDLTNAILAKMTKRLDDVILLDIAEYNYPFGLNLFTCSDPTNLKLVSEASSKVMHVFKKLWGKGGIVVEDAWGVLLEEILRNATMTFLECSQYEAYTMAEIPLLLEDERFRNYLVQKLTFRNVKNYWLNKYNRLSDKDQLEERRSTLNRVNAFLTQPLVENMVGQAKTTIDFRRIMDERKILLVMLDRRMEDVTSLIGSMIIAEFLDAAYSRTSLPIEKRKQFNLYADEFQLFATEDFATLLTEARKFGVATTIAHQIRDQLDLQNRSATLNVANLVVFKISGKDAEELSAEFHIVPPPAETRREAILAPKQDVLAHLMHQGHKNPEVSSFAAAYFPKLQEAAQQQIDKSPMGLRITKLEYVRYPHVTFPEGDLYAFDPEAVRKHLITFNDYLFNVNSHKEWKQISELDPIEPNEMIKAFAPVLGFPHYYLGHTEPRKAEGINALRRLKEIVAEMEQVKERMNQKPIDQWTQQEVLAYRVWHDKIKKEEDEVTGALHKEAGLRVMEELVYQGRHNLPIGEKIEIYGNRLFAYRYEGRPFTEDDIINYLAHDVFLRERNRFIEFHKNFFMAMFELIREPIMVESGSFEQKPLAPRTYADVQKEIATTLANLPRFTARVKIATDTQPVEHTVKILSPEQGIGRTALEQRKATIKAQNLQHGYYRLRQEVEQEITNRQQLFSGSPPAQPQQHPRHARQVPVQGKCPSCGFSNNPSAARFCMQCGTKL